MTYISFANFDHNIYIENTLAYGIYIIREFLTDIYNANALAKDI